MDILHFSKMDFMDTSFEILDQLVTQGGIMIDEAESNAFKPAELCIYEWKEYLLDLPGVDLLMVGTHVISPFHKDLFHLRFENQLGISRIQPIIAGKRAPKSVFVEVISPKFSTIKEHHIFYSSLLNDLFQRVARLPFTYQSPTGRNVVEALRPPTPLFAYHFLKHYGNDLRSALDIIMVYPHRLLVDEETFVSISLASNVDPDAILDMIQKSSQWIKAESHPLADRLGGFVPAQIFQHIPEETYDTPENRFILNFLRILLLAADDLLNQPWWLSVPKDDQQYILETRFHFQQAINHPIFEVVGDQYFLPLNSQVLLRRDGYRDMLNLWQKFQQARRPLFEPLYKAIETRNVAELYEFWAFFALVEKIGNNLSLPPILELVINDERGLNWSSRASFEPFGTVIFNRTFRNSYEVFHSYSASLRPDFTWVVGGIPIMIFDAKFSFSIVELSAESEEQVDLYEHRPSLGDLYKMHTYRDALGLHSAVIVYPGNSIVFFDTQLGKLSQIDLSKCLSGEVYGIGAIPMRPGLIF